MLTKVEPAGQPPVRWPTAAVAPCPRRRVLVIGSGMVATDWHTLESEGFLLDRVPSVRSGLRALLRRPYAAVLVAPTIEEEGDGVHLVREVGTARLSDAPVVILPMAGTTEYAVLVQGTVVLRDALRCPVGAAVVRLARD